MKNPTAPKKSNRRRVTEIVAATSLGATLLFGGSTLGGWTETETIATPATQIAAGELALSMASELWLYNGAVITEADLASTPLVPGDVLSYHGYAQIGISGDLHATLAFSTAATGTLASSAIADIEWSVAGDPTAKTVTRANDGAQVPVSWSLTMAPVGDPAYANGSEGERQTLVLDDIRVELIQVAK